MEPQFTPETFDFEGYLTQVEGVALPEGGLSDGQKNQIFQKVIADTYSENLKNNGRRDNPRIKLFEKQRVIEQFGEPARQVFGVPAPVEDPDKFLTLDSLIERNQDANKDGFLNDVKIETLAKKQAELLTDDVGFFEFPQYRERDGLSRDEIVKGLQQRIINNITGGEDGDSEFTKDSTLGSILKTLEDNRAAQEKVKNAEPESKNIVERGLEQASDFVSDLVTPDPPTALEDDIANTDNDQVNSAAGIDQQVDQTARTNELRQTFIRDEGPEVPVNPFAPGAKILEEAPTPEEATETEPLVTADSVGPTAEVESNFFQNVRTNLINSLPFGNNLVDAVTTPGTFKGFDKATVAGVKQSVTSFDLLANNTQIAQAERVIEETKKQEDSPLNDKIIAEREQEIQRLKGELPEVLTKYADLEKIIQDNTPKDLTTTQKGFRSGAQSLVRNTLGLLASAVLRTPSIAITSASVQTLADSYGAAIKDGMSHADATTYAIFDMGIEAGTEIIPAKMFVDLFKATNADDVAAMVGRFIVSDLAGEQVATLAQSMNAYGAGLDKELENAETFKEKAWIQVERQKVTAIASLFSSSVQGVGGGVIKVATADTGGNSPEQVEEALVKEFNENLQNNTEVVDENTITPPLEPIEPDVEISETAPVVDETAIQPVEDIDSTTEEVVVDEVTEPAPVERFGVGKDNDPYKTKSAATRRAKKLSVDGKDFETVEVDGGYLIEEVSDVVESEVVVDEVTEPSPVETVTEPEVVEEITPETANEPTPVVAEDQVDVTPIMKRNIDRDIPTVQSEIEKKNFRLAHARTRTIMRDSDPEQRQTFLDGIDLDALKAENDPLAQDIVGFIEGRQAVIAPNDSKSLSSLPDTGARIIESARKEDIPPSNNTIRADDFIVESPKVEIPVPIKTTKQGVSFDNSGTKQALEDNGFTVVSSTPKTITSYKDGIIYQQKVVTNKNKGATVRTTIKDLDGVAFRSGPRSQQIAQSGNQTTNSVSLLPVTKGVRIVRSQDGSTLLDPASADEFATRLGGDVAFHDRELLGIRVQDDTFTLLEQDGELTIVRNIDGELQSEGVVDEGQALQVLDTSVPNLSVTTRQLENSGYEVSDISVKDQNTTITLSKEGAEDITLSKKGQRNIRIKSGLKNIPVTELNSLIDDSAGPSTIDASEVRSQERAEYMDTTRILTGAEATNDGIKINNENGLDVDIVVDPQEDIQATADNFLASTGNTSTEDQLRINNEDQYSRDWDISEVQEKLQVLPDHIRRMIRLETSADVLDANGGRVRGFFTLKSIDGPQIVIDARSTHHSLNDVMETIAHELSHFSTESWLSPGLNGVIDRAYNILKPNMAVELPDYINRYGVDENTPIDLDNPTAHQKWLLVHEYLAKLNTTLLDIDSTKDLGSLEADQINALKKEVSGKLNEVVIDLTEDVEGDPATAKRFLENIIRLQAGWLNSNSVRLDVRNGDDSITVRSTPRGRETAYLNGTEDANHTQYIRRINKKSLSGNRAATFEFFANEHIRGLVGRQFLPDSIVRLVDGGLSSFTKRFVSNIRRTESDRVLVQSALESKLPGSIDDVKNIEERLADINTDYSAAVETELAIPVDFTTNVNKTYVQSLIDAGYKEKNSGLFQAAKRLDDLHNGLERQQHDKIVEIRQNGRKQEKVLNGILKDVTEKGLRGTSGEVINQKIIDIRSFISRFESDYTHRQYEAYTPQGLKDLEIIESSLVTAKEDGVSLDEQATKAREKIAKVRSERDAGKINEVKARAKIKELSKPLDLLYRKELILMWARRGHKEADGSPITEGEAIRIAQQRIADIRNKNVQDSQRTTSQKMQLIDGVRGRKLDPELDVDRLMMRFLKPLSDPTELAIGTLEQMNKVVFTLQWAENYSRRLYNAGIALPIGSLKPEDWTGSSSLFDGQEGTVLSALEVPSYAKNEIEKITKIQDSMHEGWLSRLITAAKRDSTVNNPDVWFGNYLGNLGLLAMSGHIAYMGRYLPTKNENGTYDTGPAWQATKDQFKERLTYSVSEGDGINTIVQEMNDFYLSQGGVSSLEASVNNNDLLEKIVDATINLIPDKAVGSNTKIKLNQKFKRLNDLIAEGYGLGDDYAKILPYIMNRELMVAKYQEQVNRSEYATEDDYREAILKLAVPEAVQLTAEETFVWAQAPTFVKQISNNRFNPFSSSFVMHPVQWMRIVANLHSRQIKQTQELVSRGGLRGDGSEYHKLLRSRVLTRGLGLGITDTSTALLASGTTGLFTLGFDKLLDLVDSVSEDEEDDQSKFDIDGALTITNINTFNGSVHYIPVPGSLDDKGNFIAIDWGRMNVVNTLVPLAQRDTEFSFGEALSGIGGKFLGTDRSGNLPRRFFNLTATTPEDGFGNEITRWEAAKELASTFIPIPPTYASKAVSRGGVAIDLAESKIDAIKNNKESPESDAKDISELLKTFGVRMKHIDPSKELSGLGYEVARDTRENLTLKSYIKAMRTGDTISVADAQNKADALAKEASATHRKYLYHMQGLVKYRDSLPKKLQKKYSNSKIVEYMHTSQRTGKKTGASKKKLDKLVRGQNIFLADLKSDINRKIKDERTKKQKVKNDARKTEQADKTIASLKLILGRLPKN